VFSLVSLGFLQRHQFLAVDGHFSRGFNPQSDLATVDINERNADVVTDEDLLAELSGEY